MIGTEFLKGQGLGNQLFCYVTARCIAIDNNVEFGTASQENFANNIHSNKGMYFMNVDLGREIDKEKCSKIVEREERLITPTSKHNMTLGVYVAGSDKRLLQKIEDNTLIYGNLQAEEYFIKHKDEIKEWLKVNKEYFRPQYSDDNLCILNMRGGEYVGNSDLYLKKKYWTRAMAYMKKINSNMQFLIITEDVEAANIMFPKIPAYHLGMGEDYAAIHAAKYLIVSNSSFAFFPIFTSDNVETVIAPKFWAGYNYSDGYWASEQNIYTGWKYLGRDGNLYTADECRDELKRYKQKRQRRYNRKQGLTWTIQVNYYRMLNLLNRLCRKVKRGHFHIIQIWRRRLKYE